MRVPEKALPRLVSERRKSEINLAAREAHGGNRNGGGGEEGRGGEERFERTMQISFRIRGDVRAHPIRLTRREKRIASIR